MTGYVLRRTHKGIWHWETGEYESVPDDEVVFFRKADMPRNTAVLYLTETSAKRAMSQLAERSSAYRIEEVTVGE